MTAGGSSSSSLGQLIRAVDWVAKVLSSACAVMAALMLLAMVFLVAYGAIFRYFGMSTIGVEEIGGFAMVGIAFLPLGFVLMKKEHITVDLLVRRAGDKVRHVLFMIVNLAVGLFFCAFLIRSSFWLIGDSYSLHSVSTTLRIPIYLPQLFVLIGSAVFCLALAAEMMNRCLNTVNILRCGHEGVPASPGAVGGIGGGAENKQRPGSG